jgi:hypothetical protein
MTESARLVTVGTVNSGVTLIRADVTFLEPAGAVRVTLSTDYAQQRPPGWPARPGETGVRTADIDYPRTIPSGTTMAFLKPEADALVATGAGTYA